MLEIHEEAEVAEEIESLINGFRARLFDFIHIDEQSPCCGDCNICKGVSYCDFQSDLDNAVENMKFTITRRVKKYFKLMKTEDR